jgi:hypothetical protein
MSGAILETFVFGEILKSWWSRGKEPSCFYVRDKEGKEVDFVLLHDQALYPIEVKKSANPQAAWAHHFRILDRLKPQRKDGAVVCLYRDLLPLDRQVTAVPIRYL